MNMLTSMPEESGYSDDTDFLNEELIRLQFILPVAAKVLKEWNLKVNESKTEFVHFFKAEKDQVAFKNYNDVWLQGKKIGLAVLIKVYEAMVTSVMMYNCSSWAATKDVLKKLDVCHRKHLRRILNIKWPCTINNEKLYEICNTIKLSDRVAFRSRWKMFGHILRSPENSPAALSLSFAVDGSKAHKGRVSSHKTNLLKILRADLEQLLVDRTSEYLALKKRPTLGSLEDVENLRMLAKNRTLWRDMFDFRIRS